MRIKKTLLPLAGLCLALLALCGGCKSGGPATMNAAPAESCVFRIDSQQIGLPGPAGFSLKSANNQISKAAAAWLTPPETVFAVYARANPAVASGDKEAKQSDTSDPLRGNSVVIISALPEFSGLNLSEAQFASMRNDMSRIHGSWHDSAPADFARLSGAGYRELPAFTYSLGIYRQNNRSVSVARIVKNQEGGRKTGSLPAGSRGTRPDANGAALSHAAPYLQVAPNTGATATTGATGAGANRESELTAKAEQYFASGSFTLSIRNLVYSRGKIFNIYYNVPLRRLEEIKPALEANARYLETVTRQGLTTERQLPVQPAGQQPEPAQPEHMHQDTVA